MRAIVRRTLNSLRYVHNLLRYFNHRHLLFECSFFPERGYDTFGSLLSQFRISVVCLSSVVCRLSVTLVHPTQGLKPFGNISPPPCTLAILLPPCKILRRSSQENPSVGSVQRKRGIKIKRFWTYRRLYFINGTRQTYSFY